MWRSNEGKGVEATSATMSHTGGHYPLPGPSAPTGHVFTQPEEP